MDDCRNAEMKDRLPELLGDAGQRPALEPVRAHASACPSCRSELALLRAVRDAHPAPRVDVERIAVAIPPYRGASLSDRVTRSMLMRLAAGFVLMIGVAATARLVQREGARKDTVVARAEAARLAGEIAVGASLTDLSVADLESLLRDLGQIEAVTSTEEDVVILPALDRAGT